MKYTIFAFSQEKAIELGLDERDLMLLRWFIDYKDTGKMKREIVGNELYYWIKYEGVAEAFPITKWKKDTVYRRLKNMVKAGVLKHTTIKSGGVYSYYTIGEKYLCLLDTNNERTPGAENEDGGVGKKSEPVGKKSVTNNSSININLNNIYINKVIESWNSLNDLGVSKIRSISPKRLKLLNERVNEYSEEEIIEAIENIRKSSFLVGNNDRNWIITFDWFLDVNRFVKVLEGNYNDKVKVQENKNEIKDTPKIDNDFIAKLKEQARKENGLA